MPVLFLPLIGFYNILEAFRHSPVEHLVYASSSSVYGGNRKVLFSTDDKVDHPISLYAATKKSNKLMAHAYSKLYNIPSIGSFIVTLKISNNPFYQLLKLDSAFPNRI